MSNFNLDYYKSLCYTVTIKLETDENEKRYIAYCNEFGINPCHGIGKTPDEALRNFLFEKDIFITFLYENKQVIPEPQN